MVFPCFLVQNCAMKKPTSDKRKKEVTAKELGKKKKNILKGKNGKRQAKRKREKERKREKKE